VGEAADLVRAAFERANAGDSEGLAALCDESVEFHDVPEIPGSTTYRGHAGIQDWLRSVREVSDPVPDREDRRARRHRDRRDKRGDAGSG
jgi:ketosteroid isomerase-like protein